MDIDEVIFPFVSEFAPWHNQMFGTNVGFEDFHSYEFEDVLDISVPEVVERVHLFLGQEHRHRHVSPIEMAADSMHRLAKNFEIHAVTARHPSYRDETKEYLDHYFGESIQDITLVGHAANMDVLKTKASVCKEIGAVALVDDSVAHLEKCLESDIGAVLFGDYPWNSGLQVPDGIIRCRNWEETVDYLESTI